MLLQLFAAIAVALIALPASAAEYPAEGALSRATSAFTLAVMPEIRCYRTVGEPTGQPC
jgi:hypothetical protein